MRQRNNTSEFHCLDLWSRDGHCLTRVLLNVENDKCHYWSMNYGPSTKVHGEQRTIVCSQYL